MDAARTRSSAACQRILSRASVNGVHILNRVSLFLLHVHHHSCVVASFTCTNARASRHFPRDEGL